MNNSTKYVVVRYVPDTVADERINFGVLATDGDRADWKAISNWERAKSFGGEDVTFLQEFSQKLSQDIADGKLTGANASELMQQGQGWMNAIQMSGEKHSLEPIEAFMQTFPQTVLKSDGMQQVEADKNISARTAMSDAAATIANDQRSEELAWFSDWNLKQFHDLALLTEYSDLGCALEVMEKAWEYSHLAEEHSDLEAAIEYNRTLTVREFVSEAFDFDFDLQATTKPAYDSPLKYLQAVADDHVTHCDAPTYRGFYAELEAQWYENEKSHFAAPRQALTLIRKAAETDANAIAEEFELMKSMKPAVKQLWEALKQDRQMQATGRTTIEGDDYRIIATPESFEIRRNQGPPIAFTWNEGEVPRLNSTVDKTEAAALASKVQAAVRAIASRARTAQAKGADLEI